MKPSEIALVFLFVGVLGLLVHRYHYQGLLSWLFPGNQDFYKKLRKFSFASLLIGVLLLILARAVGWQ